MSLYEPYIEKNKLVSFHWNSHKNCYSILEMKSKKTVGKLIGYSNSISLSNSYFVFHESKRKYTLSSNKKERHSFVVGNFQGFQNSLLDREHSILYYNPFVSLNFIDAISYFNNKKIIPVDSCQKLFATSTTEFGDHLKPHILYFQ